MAERFNLPPSLAVSPNIPPERQTLHELKLERAYWQRKIDESAGTGGAAAMAAEFRDACDAWIRRREKEATPHG